MTGDERKGLGFENKVSRGANWSDENANNNHRRSQRGKKGVIIRVIEFFFGAPPTMETQSKPKKVSKVNTEKKFQKFKTVKKPRPLDDWCDLDPGNCTEIKVEEGLMEITRLEKAPYDTKPEYRCTYAFGVPSYFTPSCDFSKRLSVATPSVKKMKISQVDNAKKTSEFIAKKKTETRKYKSDTPKKTNQSKSKLDTLKKRNASEKLYFFDENRKPKNTRKSKKLL